MLTMSILGLVAIVIVSMWIGYVAGSILAMNRLLAQLQRAGFRVKRKGLEVTRTRHTWAGNAHEKE